MEEGILIRGPRRARARARTRARAAFAAASGLAAVVLTLACARPGSPGAVPAVDAPALQQRVAGAAGHPLLLVFWATWCKPCVEEMPALVALHAESPAGLRVTAVSLDVFLSGATTQQVVQDYLAAHPAPLDHVVYAGGQDAIFTAFELPGSIPYAILYGAKGEILQRFEAAVDPAAVRAALQSS